MKYRALFLFIVLGAAGCISNTKNANPQPQSLDMQAAIQKAKQFKNYNSNDKIQVEANRAKNHWVVIFRLNPPTPDGFESVTVCDCGRVFE